MKCLASHFSVDLVADFNRAVALNFKLKVGEDERFIEVCSECPRVIRLDGIFITFSNVEIKLIRLLNCNSACVLTFRCMCGLLIGVKTCVVSRCCATIVLLFTVLPSLFSLYCVTSFYSENVLFCASVS